MMLIPLFLLVLVGPPVEDARDAYDVKAYRLDLRGGVLEEHPLSPVAAPAGESTVTIDSVERVLRFAAETVTLDP